VARVKARGVARDPVSRYADRVANGKIPAGTLHRLACVRHLEDLDRKPGGRWSFVWRPEYALESIAFFGKLRQFKGEWAGQPLTLEPWQQFPIGSWAGWRGRDDGFRRFRTLFLELPRGNGKSTIAGGLILKGTFFDGEPGAEGYSIATKKDQARITWDYAKQTVKRTPGLDKRVTPMAHVLWAESSASKALALGADEDTADGLRPHVGVADEVHAMKTSALLDLIVTGMGTRRHPVMLEITTAGVSRLGPWWTHREYSRAILEGRHVDPAWFGMICGADETDDWTLDATLRKANPNYGVSVKPSTLRTEVRKALGMPTYQAAFRRLHVGQLVEAEDKAIDMRQWNAAALDASFEWASLRALPCWGGLDLSTTTDLTAFALVWWVPALSRLVARVWLFMPEAMIAKRTAEDKVPYDVWAREGFIMPTAGHEVDYEVVRALIGKLGDEYSIQAIGFDPWNATDLSHRLEGDGFVMVKTRQGYPTLSEPTKRLIGLLASGGFGHEGNPALDWQADAVSVARDPADNWKPDKSKSRIRIDGIVAIINAMTRWIGTPEAAPSVYRTRGAVVL
jgi:phage terminase large subunit-like protein